MKTVHGLIKHHAFYLPTFQGQEANMVGGRYGNCLVEKIVMNSCEIQKHENILMW